MKSYSALQSGSARPPEVLAVAAQGLPDQVQALARARAFAEPLLVGEFLDTGENSLVHADAVAVILREIGGAEAMQAAVYLVYACDHLQKPQEVITKAFGVHFASLAVETTKLVQVQRQARQASASAQLVDDPAVRTENVRKMLLAFSRDLRVVLLRLASRLQTLRYHASTKQRPAQALADESLHVFAPLANRLGIWQIKWEMEDLAFRFLEPETYKQVAQWLDEKRVEREQFMQGLRAELAYELGQQGIPAQVQGRPKHIYSIVKKMRGKSLGFERVFDVRALRVIVQTVDDCYGALAWVHSRYRPVSGEFDDYIAKPKPNGYQSLHTVVRDEAGRAIEIQVRTQAMHEHAEHGVAAHWAYKEAGQKGYAGVSAASDYDAKIAVLRQLLAWERDLAVPEHGQGLFDDRIYVLTPDAAVVELPKGGTPVDFAYSVHTSLGHRCRGARVDGVMVPLNTALQNGQSVEIIAAKEGGGSVGPSRDWLNPELGYMASNRARAKARAWFNAQAQQITIARGRESVEKLLQREGKTSIKLDDLASRMGFKSADALFESVGKDEVSVRSMESVLRPAELPIPQDDYLRQKANRHAGKHKTVGRGSILVVGVDSLLTQMAKCCKPAPPDDIRGFVTRGKGVSIHRAECSNYKQMLACSPDRAIDVEWGLGVAHHSSMYAVDVVVEAADRQGLLRDISEVFAREKVNVIGVQTQTVKDARGGTAWMTFTVEVNDSGRLARVLPLVGDVSGVRNTRRR